MQTTTRATIVVLDDSAAALELMEAALADTKHLVLLTHRADEVLELAERVRIDLLVGTASALGREPSFVDQLRALQSQMRILYLSRRAMNTGTTLLTPFALEELDAAVERALNGGSLAG